MTRILLIAALAFSVAGCDLNPLLGKPSAFQKHQERLTALEARFDASHAKAIDAPAVGAAPEPVFAPEPYAPPEPVCVPVFRVVECP